GGIFSADVSWVETLVDVETKNALVKLDPLLHFCHFDVADNVVDRCQSHRISGRFGHLLEARSKSTFVVVALDKCMDRVAISLYRSAAKDAILVFLFLKFSQRRSTAGDGSFISFASITRSQSNRLNPVSVALNMIRCFGVGLESAGQNQTDVI